MSPNASINKNRSEGEKKLPGETSQIYSEEYSYPPRFETESRQNVQQTLPSAARQTIPQSSMALHQPIVAAGRPSSSSQSLPSSSYQQPHNPPNNPSSITPSINEIETFYGLIESTSDALRVFQLCRQGRLGRVRRRLHEKERKLIRSGSVFVFDEQESGIKRWTDGRLWSPSRILGNFLIYRELEQKSVANTINSGCDETVENDDDENELNRRMSETLDNGDSLKDLNRDSMFYREIPSDPLSWMTFQDKPIEYMQGNANSQYPPPLNDSIFNHLEEMVASANQEFQALLPSSSSSSSSSSMRPCPESARDDSPTEILLPWLEDPVMPADLSSFTTRPISNNGFVDNPSGVKVADSSYSTKLLKNSINPNSLLEFATPSTISAFNNHHGQISIAPNIASINPSGSTFTNRRSPTTLLGPHSLQLLKSKKLLNNHKGRYIFKPDGLIKKTISARIDGHINHLICYYGRKDFCQGHLGGIFDQKLMADLRSVKIPPDLVLQQNFRKPAAVECGLDSSTSTGYSINGYPINIAGEMPSLPTSILLPSKFSTINNINSNNIPLTHSDERNYLGVKSGPSTASSGKRSGKRRTNSFPSNFPYPEKPNYTNLIIPTPQVSSGAYLSPHHHNHASQLPFSANINAVLPTIPSVDQNLSSSPSMMTPSISDYDKVFGAPPPPPLTDSISWMMPPAVSMVSSLSSATPPPPPPPPLTQQQLIHPISSSSSTLFPPEPSESQAFSNFALSYTNVNNVAPSCEGCTFSTHNARISNDPIGGPAFTCRPRSYSTNSSSSSYLNVQTPLLSFLSAHQQPSLSTLSDIEQWPPQGTTSK